jgi:hypothetical protein
MIIIECRNIPRSADTLVLSRGTCTVQCAHDESGLLDEYITPVYFDDQNFRGDVYVALDKVVVSLIEEYECIKIYESYIEAGNITYRFSGNVKTVFQTHLPTLAFVGTIPKIDIEGEVTIGKASIVLDNGLTHMIRTMYEGHTCGLSARINAEYLEPGLCKVYMEKDSMVCLEYSKDGYIKRRFIAPIE